MAKKRKWERKLADLFAHIVDVAFNDDALFWNLHRLHGLIDHALKRLQALPDDADSDYVENVVRETRDVVDTVLGCAFVLCQTQVTAIIAAVTRAADQLKINNIEKRHKVIKLASPRIRRIAEQVELAANHFKHHEEWPTTRTQNGRDWDVRNCKGVGRITLSDARKAGLKLTNSDNMRILAKLLGVKKRDFSDLPAVSVRLVRWRKQMGRIVCRSKVRDVLLWRGDGI